MKVFSLSVLTFFAVNGAASAGRAALPPYWDSVKQIETVINNQRLSERLIGNIVSIKRRGDLVYEVHSVMCSGTVTLEAHSPPPPQVGPTTYSVRDISSVFCDRIE
jgi:hypothetical protein